MHPDSLQQLEKKYGFKLADFLKLDNFLAPTLILIFYWLVMVVAIFSSLSIFIRGLVQFNSWIFVGLVSLVLSPLLVRLVFEQMIVLFNIHDHLRHIRDNADKSTG